jgi:starch synthase
VVWISEMLPRAEVVALLSAATVFACPSVYEPLGIVNLEAMACELAVVATATGGIPEVVVDGETGWLVPIEQVTDGSGIPVDPYRFVSDLATALTDALSDPVRARSFGQAGRHRAVESFSWSSIGDQTMTVYESALG